MTDREKLISLLLLADPNPYICEFESGSCELTTCTECRARSIADLLVENDVLPVVRCKDCIHHTTEALEMVYCPAVLGSWVDNDFFCADGERK